MRSFLPSCLHQLSLSLSLSSLPLMFDHGMEAVRVPDFPFPFGMKVMAVDADVDHLDELFYTDFDRPSDEGHAILAVARSFQEGWLLSSQVVDGSKRKWISIHWVKPLEDFMKLNTDGDVRGSQGVTGAGGILRNSSGGWIIGFMQSLGVSTVTVAELWGVLTGLELAWNARCRRLIIEMDSMVVLTLVLRQDSCSPCFQPLQRSIRNLLQRDWEVHIQHTYWEGNPCADWLSKRAIDLPLGTYVLHSAPNEMLSLLLGDIAGAVLSRFVSI
ncbi:hypothetical protein CRG98_037363 [Punica granatum]|uniref:RNase H type-1 domain-containing protein n=1 Tax=Punica granatum TaxID=22663 RepID=A0A2I0IE25_PUNGR|nr:hypothetical protein CRG98_037363 [Punica granatum]